MTKTTKKKNHFEKDLEKLESIVQDLESGEHSLDKSIEKFEEGVDLYKLCKKAVSVAEKKVKKLSDSLKEDELDA